MADINGNNRPNLLDGTAAADFIRGFDGDDVLNGLAGDDELRGGRDDDALNGGDGDDLLRGFDGDDRLNGDDGDDVLHGEAGTDRLSGGLGRDSVFGGAGFDVVTGGAGNDFLKGSDDFSVDDFVTDRVFGGANDDLLDGTDASRDLLFGETGNDDFIITNDDCYGGTGDDGFSMGFGGGRITAGRGSDQIFNTTLAGDGRQTLVVTDFTAQDLVSWSASDAEPRGFRYESEELFDLLDRNRNDVLERTDGASTTVDGVEIGVSVRAGALVLAVAEDRMVFEHVQGIAAADWI